MLDFVDIYKEEIGKYFGAGKSYKKEICLINSN